MPRRPAWMTAEDRFVEKCRPVASGCIEWTGGTTQKGPKGYGVFYVDGGMKSAHRWAYEQVHGKLAPNLDACHTCDNRKCVNVAHLFAGTRQENMDDAKRKGRMSRATRTRGETHPQATLTDIQVREMRLQAADGVWLGEIAARFDTSYMIVYRVVNRLTWRHI